MVDGIVCNVCHHHCHLENGQVGFCNTRFNQDGKNVSLNYGKITSLAFDPIEKKPLASFYRGSYIISVGSFGCNLRCPFCQNYSISMKDNNSVSYRYLSSDELAQIVVTTPNNLGVAFTYNEMGISYEYIIDVAKKLGGTNKKVVLVSNGNISSCIVEKLAPYIDAANIDYKGDSSFYASIQGSEVEVRNTISTLVKHGVHVEVTTLIIPNKNDSKEWMNEVSSFLEDLDPNIVLHISRYFPSYQETTPKTPIETLISLQSIAKQHLNNVFLGNV